MDYKAKDIPVEKIISSTDRKYGGEGSIETLAQSINEYGLIHPPAVKESADEKGFYRVIAGRRRYEAIKSLGWKTVEAHVYPNEADDEAIALAENVNREDLHPLDEAETFKHQLDSGKFASVEEMAKYYARSVSGIHHRIRLTNLIDGIKTMFRDGKINISGAALIASLPEEDQEKFLKKFQNKNVNHWDINVFFQSVQKFTIERIADKECEACKKRTHNTTPGLFDDFTSLEDVCFDNDCYAKKWQGLIASLIAEKASPASPTENNLVLDCGVPKFLPKKTKSVEIAGVEYALLEPNGYGFKETKKKSKNQTAWRIVEEWDSGRNYVLTASRVTYEKQERQDNGSYRPTPSDPVKEFMIDKLPDIKPEDQKPVAEAMKKKHQWPWNFLSDVKIVLLSTIIEKRLKEESRENMAALYLAAKYSGEDENDVWHEIDSENWDMFAAIFGKVIPLSEIPIEPWSQKIFTFIIAEGLQPSHMPDLKDSEEKWESSQRSLFWRFAQMSREEYTAMYQGILTEAIKKELEAGDAPAEAQQGDSIPDDVPWEDDLLGGE